MEIQTCPSVSSAAATTDSRQPMRPMALVLVSLGHSTGQARYTTLARRTVKALVADGSIEGMDTLAVAALMVSTPAEAAPPVSH